MRAFSNSLLLPVLIEEIPRATAITVFKTSFWKQIFLKWLKDRIKLIIMIFSWIWKWRQVYSNGGFWNKNYNCLWSKQRKVETAYFAQKQLLSNCPFWKQGVSKWNNFKYPVSRDLNLKAYILLGRVQVLGHHCQKIFF